MQPQRTVSNLTLRKRTPSYELDTDPTDEYPPYLSDWCGIPEEPLALAHAEENILNEESEEAHSGTELNNTERVGKCA